MSNTDVTPNVTTIELSGDICIQSLPDLHQRLQAALDRRLPIVLVAADAERADAAGLQTLTAFIVAAKRQGLSWSWASASAGFRSTVGLLGLQQALGLEAVAV